MKPILHSLKDVFLIFGTKSLYVWTDFHQLNRNLHLTSVIQLLPFHEDSHVLRNMKTRQALSTTRHRTDAKNVRYLHEVYDHVIKQDTRNRNWTYKELVRKLDVTGSRLVKVAKTQVFLFENGVMYHALYLAQKRIAPVQKPVRGNISSL